MPIWLEKFSPILILLVVITFVIGRLPKIDLGHSDDFRKRRILNWLPMGLTYAFLYMGRYNLKVSKLTFEQMTDGVGGAMMSNADFNDIFGYGTLVYGCSFLINGPLTDRFGGKLAILVGAAGAAIAANTVIVSNLVSAPAVGKCGYPRGNIGCAQAVSLSSLITFTSRKHKMLVTAMTVWEDFSLQMC